MARVRIKIWGKSVLSAAMVAFASCDDGPAAPPQPTGTYTLVAIDGRAVPVYRMTPPAPGVDGHRTMYRSGSIEFDGSDATSSLDKSMEWPRDTWTEMRIVSRGTFTRRGDGRYEITVRQIQINHDAPVQVLTRNIVTAWAADSLVVVDEGGYMLYRR